MNTGTEVVRVVEKAQLEVANRLFVVLLFLINATQVIVRLYVCLWALRSLQVEFYSFFLFAFLLSNPSKRNQPFRGIRIDSERFLNVFLCLL